jgi:transcriptional regulator with XRE-family HTH domain
MNNQQYKIGKRIRALRKEKKLTQSDFAKKIGRDASTVSKIESGELESSGLITISICNTFGVRKEWLLTGKGPKYDDRKRLLEKMAKELGDDIWIWFLKIKSAYNKDLKAKEEAVGDIFNGRSVSLEEVEESYDSKFYKLLGQFESIYEKEDPKKITAIESIFSAFKDEKNERKVFYALKTLLAVFEEDEI